MTASYRRAAGLAAVTAVLVSAMIGWHATAASAASCGPAETTWSASAGRTYLPGHFCLEQAGTTNRLVFQSDGNLVLYQGNHAVRASNTDSGTGRQLALQRDGNVVVYGCRIGQCVSGDTHQALYAFGSFTPKGRSSYHLVTGVQSSGSNVPGVVEEAYNAAHSYIAGRTLW